MDAIWTVVTSANGGFNGSRVAWGLAAIVASLGSRFVITETTPAQQAILRHPLTKRAVIFCMFFLPTRDALLSVCLTVVAVAVLETLLNERSPYTLLPHSLRALSAAAGHAGGLGALGGHTGHGAHHSALGVLSPPYAAGFANQPPAPAVPTPPVSPTVAPAVPTVADDPPSFTGGGGPEGPRDSPEGPRDSPEDPRQFLPW